MDQNQDPPGGFSDVMTGDSPDGAGAGGDPEAGVRPGPDAGALVVAAAGSEVGPALEAIRRLRPLLDEWEKTQVVRARELGWNWADIAKALGRHRQAVHREYGPKKSSTAEAEQTAGD